MKYIVILMTLIVWWFLIGMGLNFLLLDDTILSAELQGNTTLLRPNTTDINFSSELNTQESTGIGKFSTAIRILFGFKAPENVDIPDILVTIISFINWFAFVITIVTIYKLVNPISSG